MSDRHDLPPVETAENEPVEALEPVADEPSFSGPPENVTAWWDAIDAELAAVPANPEATHVPQFSTAFSDTFSVTFTSIGPYRISAFISVPKGDGPFPALFLAPNYASVVTPPTYEDRQRYVVMSLRYRGTRGSDWPYAGRFPGMLTDGIDDPDTWIMRGVIADTLRGFEVLRGWENADTDRMAINGGDTGLWVSGRRDGVMAQAVSSSFYYRLRDAHPATEAYPLEEINDYLRYEPNKMAAVRRTLSHVDPLYLAPKVTAQLLIATDNAGWWDPLRQALPNPAESYDVTHEGQTDRDAIEGWIADRLGVKRLPRTWIPEEIGPWSS